MTKEKGYLVLVTDDDGYLEEFPNMRSAMSCAANIDTDKTVKIYEVVCTIEREVETSPLIKFKEKEYNTRP